MVGGTVIGVSRRGGELLLNVKDHHYGDECAVRCEDRRADTGDAVRVMPGDQVWWQCGKVYWTPNHADITEGDIPLRKVGYSH